MDKLASLRLSLLTPVNGDPTLLGCCKDYGQMHIKVFCKVLRKFKSLLAYTAPWHIVGAQRYMLGYFLIANLCPGNAVGLSAHHGSQTVFQGAHVRPGSFWGESDIPMY